MLIKDVMNINVKTIKPTDSVKNAAEKMTKNHIGSLVVISTEGQVKGIITERDILSDVVALGGDCTNTKVEEIMTTNIITISPENTLEETAKEMTENKIKKLPVIDEVGKIVGIVTASDLVAYEQKMIEKLAELLVSPEVRKIGG
ncbi:MAG: CBS domain-containing protein [Nanoarchaeota archaeon]|nr:CBS domain-containing protein [Nanoarchaeota archaeon]